MQNKSPALVRKRLPPARIRACAGARGLFSGAEKETPKPKNRTNSAKEFSEQFEGVTGHYPLKQGFLRQIAPENSPESSAKSLLQSSLGYLFCPVIFWVSAPEPQTSALSPLTSRLSLPATGRLDPGTDL